MPIPSQPTTNISLGPTLSPTSRSIASEFGDPSPHSSSEFYRGGTRVANHPINASVPTSGAVSFSQYNGASIVYRYTISTNTQNLDLFAYASSPLRPATQNISQGYDQERRYVANQPGYGVEFVINPGVVIGSATAAQNALVTGADGASGWHPTVKILLKNQGTVVGAGGAGGQGNLNPGFTNGAAAGGGGTAIVAQRALVVQNQGTVAGGSGGGGGGGYYSIVFPAAQMWSGGGGGGGRGQSGGAGGQAGALFPGGGPGQAGQAGTFAAGGAGGAGGTPQAGRGGGGATPFPGGALGTAGQAGQAGTSGPGNPGGAAGYYSKGDGNITWQETGTRQGQVQPTV
jgi:hypothetical protein